MIIFAYPYDQITKQISVRDPDLMDQSHVNLDVAFRTSMSGAIFGKRKTNQPRTLTWTFVDLPRLKSQEFRDFIAASAGYDVRLIDFNGTTWRGRLTISKVDVTTTGHGIGAGSPESATMSIEFEGKVVGLA